MLPRRSDGRCGIASQMWRQGGERQGVLDLSSGGSKNCDNKGVGETPHTTGGTVCTLLLADAGSALQMSFWGDSSNRWAAEAEARALPKQHAKRPEGPEESRG